MNTSLRLRLVIIILAPLLLIAALLASWAFLDAQKRAKDLFDQSLLSSALAVSRDVALSGGDALSLEVNTLLRNTSDGTLFYHVYAPDGVFVTGYATPPVPGLEQTSPQEGQVYFDGTYQGTDVRALRFSDVMQLDGLSGQFTVTVWQPRSVLMALANDLSWRTFQVIAGLITAVALIVWFGVRYGLRPLLSLEAAIERRSPDDLTPIQRKVPAEARGIVGTLNHLFGQLTSTLDAKDVFISNAAHQLRNPIAGVVAMSEAVRSAKTIEDVRERSDELLISANHAANLANKLLALERATEGSSQAQSEDFDLVGSVQALVQGHSETARGKGVTVAFSSSLTACRVLADRTMITEAINNLIENALLHAGPDLTSIECTVQRDRRSAVVSVTDNGRGLKPEEIEAALSRFGQVSPSDGSGLGLAIAKAVAEQHGGSLEIEPREHGLTICFRIATDHAVQVTDVSAD